MPKLDVRRPFGLFSPVIKKKKNQTRCCSTIKGWPHDATLHPISRANDELQHVAIEMLRATMRAILRR